MALAVKPAVPIEWLDAAEGRAFFDAQARATLGISGDDFLRQWDAGAYHVVQDELQAAKVRRLAALIPFARPHV
jgi:hypothetical protein